MQFLIRLPLKSLHAQSKFIYLCFCVFSSSSLAADGSWEHNGSKLRLEANGNFRRFYYVSPRENLPAKEGDLLFEGTRTGFEYNGVAYSFSKLCSPISFIVRGHVSSDQRSISMSGKAPRRNASCQIQSYSEENLIFTFLNTSVSRTDVNTAPPNIRPDTAEQKNSQLNETVSSNSITLNQPLNNSNVTSQKPEANPASFKSFNESNSMSDEAFLKDFLISEIQQQERYSFSLEASLERLNKEMEQLNAQFETEREKIKNSYFKSQATKESEELKLAQLIYPKLVLKQKAYDFLKSKQEPAFLVLAEKTKALMFGMRTSFSFQISRQQIFDGIRNGQITKNGYGACSMSLMETAVDNNSFEARLSNAAPQFPIKIMLKFQLPRPNGIGSSLLYVTDEETGWKFATFYLQVGILELSAIGEKYLFGFKSDDAVTPRQVHTTRLVFDGKYSEDQIISIIQRLNRICGTAP